MWPLRRKKHRILEDASQRSPGENEESISKEEPAPKAHVVTDTLDLHGLFPEQIPEIIRDFIDNAHSLKLRRLRIVHGKGKSRLKWEVHRVLKASSSVETYGDAPPQEGGWGATVVVLKGEGKEQ
jgi:dsDNA-specific endonuclease/ATPase MutS2